MEAQESSLLELQGLVKRYPGVVALDHVSMSFRRGEVHALVGENGAGKSTLIKCVTGCITPTDGKILYEGTLYEGLNPIQAIGMGIGAVYQEFNLVPYLTVAENIFYGREERKGLFLDREQMNRKTKEIMESLGIDMDARMRVKDLTVAYQQIVEIAKSVSRNVKMLILDEPSAPLTMPEIEAMFSVIERLKKKGVTILYISHRLEEIFRISDRVSVMRDGRYITTLDTGQTNKQELIRLMVGRELTHTFGECRGKPGESVLEIKNLRNHYVKGVSFQLRKGEILGLGGLVGAGRTETARAIYGADKMDEGTILLDGKPVQISSPKQAIRYGIGLIPEDRKQHGALLGLSIRENITFSSLPQLSRRQLVDKRKEQELVERQIAELKIKTPSENQLVKNLSGGNQQKVILAKWMVTNCRILIFDEPTRGIDVGAKQEIYKLMRGLADSGISIIMISSEMPELLGMSDRIIVMHEGHISGELDGKEATQERVLELASMEGQHPQISGKEWSSE